MVVGVQCSRSPLPWVFANIPSGLESIEMACRDTDSVEDVWRSTGIARNEPRQLMQHCEPVPMFSRAYSPALAKLAALPYMGPDRQSLHRVLYYVDREVSWFLHSGVRTLLPVSSCDPHQRESLLLCLFQNT